MSGTSDREIVSERIFNAPPELVFKAWTEPEHMKEWWGPSGFTHTFEVFEFKPGGNWRFTMHGPDGTDFKNHWVFLEIEKPTRIVMDHVDDPKFVVTATFSPEGKGCKLAFRMLFETAAVKDSVARFAPEGNRQMLEKLDAYLLKMS